MPATALRPTPRLTICMPDRGDIRGDEIAHVDGLAESDHAWFLDELARALCELRDLPYEMAHQLFTSHIDNPGGFAKPVGLGPLPGKEIAAFARGIAAAIVGNFVGVASEMAA